MSAIWEDYLEEEESFAGSLFYYLPSIDPKISVTSGLGGKASSRESVTAVVLLFTVRFAAEKDLYEFAFFV
jgi:hypothetical protein